MNYSDENPQNPGNLPVPFRPRPKMADPVSDDLQQRTSLWVLTLAVGLALGFVGLVLAGEKGSVGWLGVLSIAGILASFLIAAYGRRKINDFISWMIVGFLFICWIAIGTPKVAEGQSGGGSQSLLISEAGLVLLLTVWGVEIFFRQTVRLIRTPINVPIALYLVFCALSTTLSVIFPNHTVLAYSPKIAVQVNILENLMRVLALGGLLMIGNKLRGKTVIVGAIAIATPGLLTYTGVLTFLSKSLFMVFPQLITMSILAAFTLSDVPWMKTWMRIVAGAVALSIVGTYFLKGTEWVSGWSSALLALAVVGWHLNRRLVWAGVAALVMIIASNPGYYYKSIYSENFYGKYLKAASQREEHGMFDNDRGRMMKAALLYSSYFPLGIGLGNYRSYNHYFGRMDVWDTTTFTSAHGTYSQALSETGWPGFLSLMAIIYGSCRMMRQYFLRLPKKSWARVYVLGGYASCIGTFFASIIGDYIFPTYHNGGLASFGNCAYTWFIIGITIAIGREYGLNWDDIAMKKTITAEPPAPIWNRSI